MTAAFELVDREGPEALSIRRLADQLGVRGPSLYYHFRNKAELVDLVVDAALEATLGQVDAAGLGRSWRRWLERLARAYRDILREHRGLASLIAQRLPNGPNGLAIYDATLGVLLDAGFSPADALAVYVGVCNYVLSAVQRELPDDPESVWTMEELARLGVAVAEKPGSYPALAAVANEALRLRADGLFDHGLRALLDGYRHCLGGG